MLRRVSVHESFSLTSHPIEVTFWLDSPVEIRLENGMPRSQVLEMGRLFVKMLETEQPPEGER